MIHQRIIICFLVIIFELLSKTRLSAINKKDYTPEEIIIKIKDNIAESKRFALIEDLGKKFNLISINKVFKRY